MYLEKSGIFDSREFEKRKINQTKLLKASLIVMKSKTVAASSLADHDMFENLPRKLLRVDDRSGGGLEKDAVNEGYY